MSLQKDILFVLKKGARTQKQMKCELATTNKKLTKALEELLIRKKIHVGTKGYELSPDLPLPRKGSRKPVIQDKTDAIPAKLVKLGRTFGFAAALDGSGDIFIPGRDLLGAMPGDEIMVSLYANPRVKDSREGGVVEVVTPQNRIVGRVELGGGRLRIFPDNAPETPIAIRRSLENGAVDGEKVAAEITSRGMRHEDHRAGVLLRFGAADSAKECAQAIVYAAGLEQEFTEKSIVQAKYASTLGVPVAEMLLRKDLRADSIFTIDSASTKDIDDAIGIKRKPSGYQLGVHIADVSYYVQPNTPLDEEAFRRGTSVYYANNVIPMLPKQLSNGICSLNEGEDRLAFSCLMDLDTEGNLVKYKFFKSIINSKRKGVYSEINSIFAGQKKPELQQKYESVADSLSVMKEVYKKLAALRAARGSMEIDSEEPNLVMDENGKCIGVEKRARGDAERMIEEFMLMANTAAAHYAKVLDIPFVYRVHEEPMADRATQLQEMLTAAGVEFAFKKEVPTQQELGKLLDKSRDTKLAKFINTAVLRSMAKAKYEPQPKGHYGLALVDYAHFTSPIRRYPDLAIHRILSDVVSGLPKTQVRKKYKLFSEQASLRSSETELVAQRVERDCDDCYKAEYMRQFIGKQFEGVISSVMQYGIYVELANTVEGMVHISHLPETHLELVAGVALTNPLTGRGYTIGDAVDVVLIGVDVSRGNIDFDLAHTAKE